MKRVSRIFPFIFCALLCILACSQFSCTSKVQPVNEQQEMMPQVYPKQAAEPYKRLASWIPADSDVLLISGYGTLADAIIQAKEWKIVDADEFQKLLNDLGTHYLLNPADLRTYFKAGMNTESGFVAGVKDKTAFLIFDVYDQVKFRKWVDNFLNEEFGRPRYHELSDGARKIVQIHILNRDFATLVEEPGKPVMITFGPGAMADAPPSLEAYHALSEGTHMADVPAAHERFISELRDAPLAAWMKSDGKPLESLKMPEEVRELYPWSEGAGFAFYLGASGPKIRAFCSWRDRQYKDMPLGQWMAGLTQGSSGEWAKAILNTHPSSMTRVLLNAEQIEPIILASLTDKQQNSYAELKDKLTQRFLKLNISEQVIYNIGAAWLVLYDAQAPAQQNATLMEILSEQSAAVFVPLRNASDSDSFFSKVNILKGFVPKDLGTVELEDEILHAKINLKDGKLAHVAYSKGLIAVSTEKGWAHVQEVFASTDAPANDSLFALDSHFFAMNLRQSDISQIFGAHYAIIREQIDAFLKPFERFEAQASANAASMEVVLEAHLSKSAPSSSK